MERVNAEMAPPEMTNLQKIQRIQDTINEVIRPGLQKDGGDIELVDVVDNQVAVRLKAACANCPASLTPRFSERLLGDWHSSQQRRAFGHLDDVQAQVTELERLSGAVFARAFQGEL